MDIFSEEISKSVWPWLFKVWSGPVDFTCEYHVAYYLAKKSNGLLKVGPSKIFPGDRYEEWRSAILGIVGKSGEVETPRKENPRFPYKPETFPEGSAPPDRPGVPKSFDTVVSSFKNKGFKDPVDAAKKFCLHYGARGWEVRGSLIKNWMICAATWKEVPPWEEQQKMPPKIEKMKDDLYAGKEDYK